MADRCWNSPTAGGVSSEIVELLRKQQTNMNMHKYINIHTHAQTTKTQTSVSKGPCPVPLTIAAMAATMSIAAIIAMAWQTNKDKSKAATTNNSKQSKATVLPNLSLLLQNPAELLSQCLCLCIAALIFHKQTTNCKLLLSHCQISHKDTRHQQGITALFS
jgi:hypothetical protein